MPLLRHLKQMTQTAHAMLEAETVIKLLGVETAINQTSQQSDTTHKLTRMVRQGLPPSAAEHIAEYYGLSYQQVSELIGISIRTLERHRRENKPLSPVQSDRLLRYARVAARTEAVFENTWAAQNWLKRANPALGGEIPMYLLDTEMGAKQVDDVLVRIEYGVYS